jgi:hypothetical protein
MEKLYTFQPEEVAAMLLALQAHTQYINYGSYVFTPLFSWCFRAQALQIQALPLSDGGTNERSSPANFIAGSLHQQDLSVSLVDRFKQELLPPHKGHTSGSTVSLTFFNPLLLVTYIIVPDAQYCCGVASASLATGCQA